MLSALAWRAVPGYDSLRMSTGAASNPPLRLDVDAFPKQHPAMNASILVEQARVALAAHGTSPRAMDFLFERPAIAAGTVAFSRPDPRSAQTFQRPRFVEDGAIVMAGLLLHERFGLQLSRATCRGSRVDYFVGRRPGEQEGVLEVKGRDSEPIEEIARKAGEQLSRSLYVSAAHGMAGYVAATRFDSEAVSLLRRVVRDEERG